jgi:glutamyl-tRNA synthetase
MRPSCNGERRSEMTKNEESSALSGLERRSAARTRFAPSPTGLQHVGGFRTALFSWLFAQHTGGQFLVRIEDTDTARSVPGAVAALLGGFEWLKMDWDEGPVVGGPVGPYFQTQRRALYASCASRLIEAGAAYRCFCTPERLQEVREAQRRAGLPPRYDRLCRALTPQVAQRRAADGEAFVVRLATPLEGQTVVQDELRGAVVFENANLDDPVLLKTNGLPTYHLAHIVDDHLMAISHVIRAEEWISSAPLHVVIYQALGWPVPHLVHVPDVLGRAGGKKLSKRFGAIPILEYRDLGYLPEAVLNYMALLGWSYDGETDVLSRDELIAAFSLDRVGTAPARYDEERLLWLNGVYIRRLTLDDLTGRALTFLERPEAAGGLPDVIARPLDGAYVSRVLALEQERMKTLAEAPALTAFFFTPALTYDTGALLAKRLTRAQCLDGLRRTRDLLEHLPEWNAAVMEAPLRALVEELALKPIQLFTAIRVAVTGRTVSPPLFETMDVLGRPTTLARLNDAIERLSGLSDEAAREET